VSQYFKVHPINPQLRLLNRAAEMRIGILKHVIAAGAVACNEHSVKASVIGTPNRLHHHFAAHLHRVDTADPGLPASPRAVSPTAR
jgi:hypothetical protein